MPTLYIAIVGPGEAASDQAIALAEEVARLVAGHGWITLCGGRNAGVMAAAARGASDAGGMVVGILPDADRARAAPRLTIALASGLREARNAVLISSADAVVGCGVSPGTASEIALALQARKPVVLVEPADLTAEFFGKLAGDAPFGVVRTPAGSIDWITKSVLLGESR